LAERKDHLVGSYKDRFARVVQQNIEGFKTEVQKEYENYRQSGPGAEHIDLDEGVALLAASKDTVAALNHRKDDYVMSENLFNLPLSKYPQLIEMEDNNKIYSDIYDIYEHHNEKNKSYAMESWNRIEPQALRDEADLQQRMVRALGKKLHMADKYAPYRKLKEAVSSFQNSLPLIEQLKQPAVQERHWNRIIEETGKFDTVGEINLKSINLTKVLELKLDQHAEIVNSICVEASAELNNEE
jgi:dynein heavy chain